MTVLVPRRAAERPPASLLVLGLSRVDVSRVATFLQVGGHRLQRRWQIVVDGSADVMLVGGAELPTIPGLLDEPAVTLRLLDHPGTAPDSGEVLTRPLQYTTFIDAIARAERHLDGPGSAPESPREAHDVDALDTIPDGAHDASRARPVEARQTSVASPAEDARDVLLALRPNARFRLRQWPPSAWLADKQHPVRIASYLSVRHVSLADLAHLSKLSQRQCAAFLVDMQAAGLLDVRDASQPAAGTKTGSRDAWPDLDRLLDSMRQR